MKKIVSVAEKSVSDAIRARAASSEVKRAGMVLISADLATEYELPRTPHVNFLTTRTRFGGEVSAKGLSAIAENLAESLQTLKSGVRIDSVAFACTSGAIVMGPDKVREVVHETFPGVPVTDPATAASTVLSELKAKNIVLVTPYLRPLHEQVLEFIESLGVNVPSSACLDLETDSEMDSIEDKDLLGIAHQAMDALPDDTEVDAIFLMCTALRASNVIDPLQKRFDIPVFSSHDALIWHIHRQLEAPMPKTAKSRIYNL